MRAVLVCPRLTARPPFLYMQRAFVPAAGRQVRSHAVFFAFTLAFVLFTFCLVYFGALALAPNILAHFCERLGGTLNI